MYKRNSNTPTTCTLPDCNLPFQAKGLCKKHYERLRIYGRLEFVGSHKHGNAPRGKLSSEYHSWADMIQRCTNPKRDAYKYYGGEGITVCKRWLDSFVAFLEDMGPKPTLKHSIDRHPNKTGNYEPSNCRWATHTQQMRNQRRNRLLEIDGVTKCLTVWAEESGRDRHTIIKRLKKGWTNHDAVWAPSQKGRRIGIQPHAIP